MYRTSNSAQIDNKATEGLEGVSNSLAYRVHEIEKHFHSYESWFAEHDTPSGEVTIATRIGSANDNGPFTIDAGNDTWGSWVQILGSGDTPARSGMVKYDLHKIVIDATEVSDNYYVQIAFGDSGASALSAGDYTEFVVHALSNQVGSTPVPIMDPRKDIGTKVWARCMCPGANTATMDFFIGVHEYVG